MRKLKTRLHKVMKDKQKQVDRRKDDDEYIDEDFDDFDPNDDIMDNLFDE